MTQNRDVAVAKHLGGYVMKRSAFVLLVLLVGVSGSLLVGCQSDLGTGPSLPVTSSDVATPPVEKPVWIKAAEAQGLEFIPMPRKAAGALNKIWITEKIVDYTRGGSLTLSAQYLSEQNRTVKVTAKLTVPAHALESTEKFQMAFDDATFSQEIDFTFGPHSFFKIPVKFDLVAQGLDLAGWPTKVQLYYYDKTTNQWAPLGSYATVNPTKGSFEVKGAKLPHFSRYAFVRWAN